MPTKGYENREFAGLLRQWRAVCGLSQKELATAVGVSQARVSLFETGRGRPSRSTAIAITRALKLPPKEIQRFLNLIGYTDEPPEYKHEWDEMPAPFREFIDSLVRGAAPNAASVLDPKTRMARMNPTCALMHGAYAVHEEMFDDGYLSIPLLALHPKGYRSRVNDFQKFESTFIRVLHEDRLRDRARTGRSLQDIGMEVEATESGPARDGDQVISGRKMVMPTPFGDLTVHTITTIITVPAPDFMTYIPDFRIHMLVPDRDGDRSILEEISRQATKEQIPEALWPAIVWPNS